MVGIEKILDVERFSIGELSICVPCISVLTVRNFQEVLFFSLHFQIWTPQPLQVRIPPLWTQSKNNTCRGVLRWKTVHLVRCIRVLVVQNFRNKTSSIIFRDIQTHPPLSPITTGFISSIEVSMKSLWVVKTSSMVIFVDLVLALEYWSSDVPNSAIWIIFHLDIETPNSP